MVQVMKTNPVYCYARFTQANIDEIPLDLKRGFKKFPSEGIICECRVKVGLEALSVTKIGGETFN